LFFRFLLLSSESEDEEVVEFDFLRFAFFFSRFSFRFFFSVSDSMDDLIFIEDFASASSSDSEELLSLSSVFDVEDNLIFIRPFCFLMDKGIGAGLEISLDSNLSLSSDSGGV